MFQVFELIKHQWIFAQLPSLCQFPETFLKPQVPQVYDEVKP